MISLERFKKIAIKNQPLLESLQIKDNEWSYIHQKFQSLKRQKFNSGLFLHYLAEQRATPVNVLLAQITKQSLPRSAKPVPIQKSHKTHHWHHRITRVPGTNQMIIMETEDMSIDVRKALEHTGARITPLCTATPEKNQQPSFKTPGGHRVKPIAKNKFSLFAHQTPQAPGLIKPETSVVLDSIEQITQPILFTATQQKMEDRKGERRKVSQKQVTGVSCSAIFSEYGINIAPQESRQYHWAHLVAWFLGGNQERQNLAPSTSQANYNTLDAVETFIMKKLVKEKIPELKIIVTPEYNGDEKIPNRITYSISYVNNNKTYEELFHIYPQSKTRLTDSSLKTIEEARAFEVQLKFE